jgi:hypothetical protein
MAEPHPYVGKGEACEVAGCGLPPRAGVHLGEQAVGRLAQVTATKLPTGEFNINADGIAPIELIGLGELIKGMGLGMISAGQMQPPKKGRN